jgi:Type II secretion system (T2SS), protein E, N-terminal domain
LPACSTRGLIQVKTRDILGLHHRLDLSDEPRGYTSAVRVASGARRPASAFVAARPSADDGSPGESLEAILRFPELDDWAPVFDRLALPGLSRTHIATEARVNGVTLFQQLLASGLVDETRLCRALADELGVPFLEKVDPEKVVVRDRHCLSLLAHRSGTAQTGFVHEGKLNFLLAVDRLDIAAAKDRLRRAPGLRERLMLAPPHAIRTALFERGRSMLAMHAIFGIRFPTAPPVWMSARGRGFSLVRWS